MKDDIARRKKLLTGNLFQTVLVICMPLALYQLFNSVHNLIDQIICASISTTAQNAVSSIGQIKLTISAFGAGLAAGGGVIVARYYGAGKIKDARRSASVLLLLSIILSGIILAIFVPLAKYIMQIAQVAPESIEIGVNYFRLQMVELIFITINAVYIGLLKAKGDSNVVLYLNIASMLVKLGLTALFVYAIELKDIVFVELASIAAQLGITILGSILMFNKNNLIRLSFKLMKLQKKYVLPILKLSIPIFLGKFVMNLGKVVVNGICGGYWNAVTDGLIVGTLGVSNNICGLITSPTNSFEEGGSSIVSQNLGNGNMKRSIRSFYYSLLISAFISIVGFVMLRFVFKENIINLFTSSDSKSEYYKQMVSEIFNYDSLSIIALGINAPVLGLLYGFGQTGLSTILNLSRIGSRIVFLVSIHSINPELSPTLCAGLSMAISNTVILLLSVLFLVIFLLKIKKHGYKGLHLSDPEPDTISKIET